MYHSKDDKLLIFWIFFKVNGQLILEALAGLELNCFQEDTF